MLSFFQCSRYDKIGTTQRFPVDHNNTTASKIATDQNTRKLSQNDCQLNGAETLEKAKMMGAKKNARPAISDTRTITTNVPNQKFLKNQSSWHITILFGVWLLLEVVHESIAELVLLVLICVLQNYVEKILTAPAPPAVLASCRWFYLVKIKMNSIVSSGKKQVIVERQGNSLPPERRKFVRYDSDCHQRYRLRKYSSCFLWCLLTSFNPQLCEGLFSTEESFTAAAAGISTVTVEYVGHSKTPVVILDNVFSENAYISLRDGLRRQNDFFEGYGYPGKIAFINKLVVDPLIKALLASEDVLKYFPKDIIKQREHIRGFASVLCSQGWVHNDYMENELGDIVAPAAVFYFGFDGTSSTNTTGNSSESTTRTGTAFYREVETGLERVTTVRGNQTEFCREYPHSVACSHHESRTRYSDTKNPAASDKNKKIPLLPIIENKNRLSSSHGNGNSSVFQFQEIHRVVATPNRLILYPQDLLHKPFVERSEGNKDIATTAGESRKKVGLPPLPCSAREGRLAISLFFLSSLGFGSVGTCPEPEKDRTQSTELRRKLVACPGFVKRETFHEIGGCVMSANVIVGASEQLHIRGSSGLVHPVLDRNGGAVAGESKIERHFKLTANGKLTLVNLELKGGWVGTIDNGCGDCGYCKTTGNDNGCCSCCGFCNGCCNCCTKCNENPACSTDAYRGGALHMEGNSIAVLVDIIFSSNTAPLAPDNLGNIFTSVSVGGIPSLVYMGMVPPSNSVLNGVVPVVYSDCSSATISFCKTTSRIPDTYHVDDTFCITSLSQIRCGCPLGYYAEGGDIGPCLVCPNGLSSLASGAKSVSECTSCSAGQFQTTVADVLTCKVCPAGYNQVQAGKPSCTACQRGLHLTADNSNASDHNKEIQCKACAKGREFTAINTSCQICAGGKYQNFETTDAKECSPCSSGFFNADNREDSFYHDSDKDCLKCPDGKHSSSGALFCDRCFAGKRTNKTTCIRCESGRFQPLAGEDHCIDCIVGKYNSEKGLPYCLPCIPGEFRNTSGATSCESCGAGRYQGEQNATFCHDCPTGYSADGNSNTKCLPCIPGEFQNLTGQHSCEKCPANTISTKDNSSFCTACGKGRSPTQRSSKCSECTNGRAKSIASEPFVCTDCTPGFWSVAGDMSCFACDAGQYQDENEQSKCIACSKGTYNENQGATNVTFCNKCPQGRYSSAIGVTNITDCNKCAAGKKNENKGSKISSACLNCGANTIAERAGSIECAACGVGRTSTPGSSKCTDCTNGRAKSSDSTDFICVGCEAGFWAAAGDYTCKECEAGRYQNEKLESKCEACSEGTYNEDRGATSAVFCKDCSRGTYSSVKGVDRRDGCNDCSPGKKGSKDGATNATDECNECGVGKYQDEAGRTTCDKCESGTYANRRGSTECFPCAPGKFTGEMGGTICEKCPSGWLQEDEGKDKCEKPVEGQISAGGASSVEISEGWVAADCDSSVCKTQQVCKAGTKGNKERTRCAPCEAGKTSFQGSMSCIPCSKGKFAAQGGSKCADCPSGFYQSKDNVPSVECVACPTGWGPALDESMKEVGGSALCRDLGGIKPSDCKDDEYFNVTECVDCPLGGSCMGDITASGIRTLFGWSQCPNDALNLTYEPCVFGAACLGAKNDALKGKFEIKIDSGKVHDPSLDDNATASCAPPYFKGGLICASCSPGYSHSGLGDKCDKCPTDGENTAVAVTGSVLGVIGLVAYIQLTLSSAGKLEPADGAQSIGMSYVQVVSLLLTFPIAW